MMTSGLEFKIGRAVNAPNITVTIALMTNMIISNFISAAPASEIIVQHVRRWLRAVFVTTLCVWIAYLILLVQTHIAPMSFAMNASTNVVSVTRAGASLVTIACLAKIAIKDAAGSALRRWE